MTQSTPRKLVVEYITEWIGSVSSLVLHTLAFVLFFALSIAGILSWDLMFLVLTTVVSLEAIYLAIFIQMTVNRHSRELEEVSEDVEGIQEDIEEINEGVDEIQKDVDDLQEDVEEMSEDDLKDAARRTHQIVTLQRLTDDVQKVLRDLEAFKRQ